MHTAEPRIGIVVVAYNASSTLLATLERIPRSFLPRIAEVIVSDDASHDDTYALGEAWALRPDTPHTHVIRHTKNLGYGGNQKAAYRLASSMDWTSLSCFTVTASMPPSACRRWSHRSRTGTLPQSLAPG